MRPRSLGSPPGIDLDRRYLPAPLCNLGFDCRRRLIGLGEQEPVYVVLKLPESGTLHSAFGPVLVHARAGAMPQLADLLTETARLVLVVDLLNPPTHCVVPT